MQQKTAVIWHLSFKPTNSILLDHLSAIDQHDKETMFMPQFYMSGGEISSMVTFSTTDCKKDFLRSTKSEGLYLLLAVVALRYTKFINFGIE